MIDRIVPATPEATASVVAAENNSSPSTAKFPDDFGISFQETLIYAFLTDVRFANEISQILDSAYFKNIYLITLFKAIIDFKNKYKVIPSVDILKNYANHEISDKRLKDGILEILGKLFDEQMYKNGSDYVKEKALNFCRTQKLDQALIKAHQMVHTSDPNFDTIRRVVQNGLSNTSRSDLTEYLPSFFNRVKAVTETVPRVPTGLVQVDRDALGGTVAVGHGGMPVKKYGVVLTFTSGGKTHFLVQLGAAAARKGYNVLHLSLEDDENDVSLRYDANFSGIPATEFLISSELQKQVYEKISKVPGKIFIREYPGRSCSITHIRNHIERMIEDGNKPNIVLVDYIAEVKSTDKRERRHELAEISRDLRAIAVEYELVMWTAAQSQRGTVHRKIVKLEEIAEAFEITHPCDFVVTIGQTRRDAEEGICKLYVAKNKTGKDGQVYVASFQKDLSRFFIREQLDSSVLDIDSIGYNVEE